MRTSSSAPAIVAEGLGKQYRLGSSGRSLKDLASMARGGGPRRERFWALRDVSLTVSHGEIVGVIGRNGSGKSTLLKVLSRVTSPTEGWARIQGEVATLLEVGTGFHPDLTGRDNIAMNAAILGMERSTLAARFDEIVEFSGVGRFLDTPVKRYSSGMKVRLAFAVAAHLEPEILLIDEVLAVGDLEFQKRCLGRMDEVARAGRAVVFVSHDMAAVTSLCSRAVVLDGGRVQSDGPVNVAVQQYLGQVDDEADLDLRARTDRKGSGAVTLTRCRVESGGRPTTQVRSGDDVTFVFEAAREGAKAPLDVTLRVHDQRGLLVAELWSVGAGANLSARPGDSRIECHLPNVPLNAGRYWVDTILVANGNIEDELASAFSFTVERGDYFGSGKQPRAGVILLNQHWRAD